jgi:hypothetical protein
MKYTVFILFSLLAFNKFSYGQLQQSNAIKVIESKSTSTILKIDPPQKIDTINLKIDATDIFRKVTEARVNSLETSLKEISNQMLTSNIKLKEAESEIEYFEKLKRNNKALNDKQEAQLLVYQGLLKQYKFSLDSLGNEAKKAKEDLDKKSTEASDQQIIKQQYRKEYYEKLLVEARENMALLNSNFINYKNELTSKEDSLAPSKWPLYSSNKDTMVREMGLIYGALLLSTKDMLRKLDLLAADYPVLQKKIKDFEEIEVVLRLGGRSDSYIDTLFNQRKAALAEGFALEKKHNDEFKKTYDTYREEFKEQIATVNEIKLKYKPVEENKQSSEASLLANFTQPLNQNSSLVPGIDIFAYKKFHSEQYSIYGQAKLFLAAPGSDTNSLNHATKYFIPEASQFGFMVDFNFGFLPAPAENSKNINSRKLLGLNLSFYYLQKQLSTKDTLKSLFSTGMVQVRTGVEFILIKNALAIYANINGFFVGKGVENYTKHYVNDEKMKWYTEFGLKSYLILQSDAKINLLLDIRFLPVGSAIKEMTFTRDRFIPLVKLGIAKEFDF